ncbi:LacI family DNA-binding transcriptional regulator [Xylanimonas ulmi]|uniref:LacI family transcriptional regulator n=1 Tax=Xylanimonas ulmi TaxID=228973 RepID=A0A4Q7M5R2_9MICO|nr:LacI family DNA-binding transcriptional regulator [Xylanibacterium ulmi]RZS62327.1 LacI family transcriptional regulator [Xylanibacterium ulmi]
MAVTMREVAALAGVSLKTVSNVINNYPYIRPETRAKVEFAIQQLDFHPNISARNLAQGRTGLIGLVLPDLRIPYFAELAYSVMGAAEQLGRKLVIEQTGERGQRELEVLRAKGRRLTDGLLFSPIAMNPDAPALLDVGYPLVLLGERVFGAPVDHVTMDNFAGARAAALHLAERGCRDIAVIGTRAEETAGSSVLRLAGLRAGLAEAGLELNPLLIAETDRWVHKEGARLMSDLLDQGVPLDGVFAMNDALALGAMHAIHRRSLVVPGDVAVIGFDNISESESSDPRLTSVDPGREQIANEAVRLLAARIDGETTPAQTVVVRHTLVRRESA